MPLRPDFARRVGLAERVAALSDGPSRQARTARQEHWLGLVSGFVPFAASMLGRTAALYGVEPRFPFLDRRVAEYCLALPPEQKLGQGWTRSIVRRALAGVLPDEVRWRTDKGSLGHSFCHHLFTADRGALEDVVLHHSDALADYVEVSALRRMYESCLARPETGDTFALWRAVTLGLWLRYTGPTACERPNASPSSSGHPVST